MARGNIYTCLCCGKKYEYCPKCAIVKPTYDAEHFCSSTHSEIFAILSKHGCRMATAKETAEALKSYDLDGVSDHIQTHIQSVYADANVNKRPKIKEVVQTQDVEVVIENDKDASISK